MSAHANVISAEYDYEDYGESSFHNYNDFELFDSEGRVVNISMSEIRAMNLNASFNDMQNISKVTANSAYLLAFAVLFVIGLLSHSTVLYIAGRVMKMRDAATIYIVNLSLGQMLFLVGCLPALAAKFAVGGWTFGPIWCKVHLYTVGVSRAVGGLSLVCVGVMDLYVGRVHPQKSTQLRSKLVATLVSVIVWLFCLGTMTPSLFLGHVVTMRKTLTNTLPNTPSDAVTTNLHRAVCVGGLGLTGSQIGTTLNYITYLIPCMVLLFCVFSVICRKYPQHTVNGLALVYGKDGVVKGVKRQTALVVLLGLIFFIGWLPLYVSNISATFGNGLSPLGFKLDHDMIVLLFAFAANAISPLVYLFKDDCFKGNIRIMFCGGRHTLVDTNDEESGENIARV